MAISYTFAASWNLSAAMAANFLLQKGYKAALGPVQLMQEPLEGEETLWLCPQLHSTSHWEGEEGRGGVSEGRARRDMYCGFLT